MQSQLAAAHGRRSPVQPDTPSGLMCVFLALLGPLAASTLPGGGLSKPADATSSRADGDPVINGVPLTECVCVLFIHHHVGT